MTNRKYDTGSDELNNLALNAEKIIDQLANTVMISASDLKIVVLHGGGNTKALELRNPSTNGLYARLPAAGFV